MQQRTEILKMLYRDNEILIFDEPTAVLTPQEIDELMQIMRNLAAEGKSILFITHKLNEIMAVADRCSVLRKGKYIGTVNVADTTKEDLSTMMVGHAVKFEVDQRAAQPKEAILEVENLCVRDKIHKKEAVKDVSFTVHSGEIVCIAGIDGNRTIRAGLCDHGARTHRKRNDSFKRRRYHQKEYKTSQHTRNEPYSRRSPQTRSCARLLA